MTKFEIEISRGNLDVSTTTLEIEAETQKEAEKQALELAPQVDNWTESGDEDYHYQVEEVSEI